jgi:GT2 family glycosyltransferase
MTRSPATFGAVVIGRNEGDRLKRCLASLPAAARIVYVDSGSDDGSVAWARRCGVDVVELDRAIAFTAARARNAGFRELRRLAPDIAYVQFIDGDCELDAGWPRQAVARLAGDDGVCAVFGRRRERHPAQSPYNRLCDIEWDVPIGPARAFGGDVMIRAAALEAVGGYRDDLIAGEEPELCVRLRARGWTIWRLDAAMTLHDAALTRFAQWWRRHVRAGFAFAEGARLHGAPPERHWVRETRRALLWGVALPVACAAASILAPPWGLAAWLVYPLQVLRLFLRRGRPLGERGLLALFLVLVRFPEAQGVMTYAYRQWTRQKPRLIEYKR